MDSRLDQADIADAIADALDGTQIQAGVLLAGADSEDEKVVVVEIAYPDDPAVDEFTVRVTKTRKAGPR